MQTDAMDTGAAQRVTIRVGLVTTAIGVALLAAPSRASQLLGAGEHASSLRIIGLLDLALVPGLLSGRQQRRWMTARAGLNLAIAAYCLRLNREHRAVGPKVAALVMMVATIDDVRTIAALPSHPRRHRK